MRARFGDLVLDGEAHVLLRGGAEEPLTPKAFALLQLLVERRPGVVSKSEICERLWPATFVSEGSLTVVMTEVRKALRETARDARLIRTVHGIGYAFIGEAREEERSRSAAVSRHAVRDGDRELPLSEGENVIGRHPACEVRVDRASVSRRHARLRVAGGIAVLVDLESKNGTFLNGERIRGEAALADGDVIGLGTTLVTFVTRGVSSTRTEA